MRRKPKHKDISVHWEPSKDDPNDPEVQKRLERAFEIIFEATLRRMKEERERENK
jgi:hypothetical protein